MDRSADRSAQRWDALFLLCLALTTAFLLWRVRYGYVSPDEGFYLAVPWRLLQGEKLFVDEWHGTQLSSLLLAPLIRISLWLHGGSPEGIFLRFRTLYACLQALTALAAWAFLRSDDRPGASAGALIFALSTPFVIYALSYNSMGGMSMFLFSALCARRSRRPALQCFAQGLLLAVAVLCNPWALLIWLAFLAACLIRRRGLFAPASFLWVTAGAGAVFVLFILALLRQGLRPADVIVNLPHVLADPEHPQDNPLRLLVGPLLFARRYWWYFAGMVPLTALGRFRPGLRPLCFALCSLLSAVLAAALLFANVTLDYLVGANSAVIPLTLLGATAALFSKGHRKWLAPYAFSLIYALAMGYSSNTRMYAIANACALSSAFSAGLILAYVRQEKKPVVAWLTALILCAQLAFEAGMNLRYCFGEVPLTPFELHDEIPEGPQAGLITSPDMADVAKADLENLRALTSLPGDTALIYRHYALYGYLMLPGRAVGAYSPWMSEYPGDLVPGCRLAEYWRLHPEKVPDWIYADVLAVRYSSKEAFQAFADAFGYDLEEMAHGALLMKKQLPD